jgi:hypothetical protein
MTLISNLSDQADMIVYVPLADGTTVQYEFLYLPTIQRWAINVIHPTITINGFMLVVAPNCLRQWKDVIPFGLMCTSTDGADPFNIEDFVNGRIQVYSLEAADVQYVEDNIIEAQAAA